LNYESIIGNLNAWNVKPVAGKHNTFVIESVRGCERKTLSVSRNCGHTYVDLWKRDDNNGLQHWKATRVPGRDNTYYFTNDGRHGCHRVHLSSSRNWDRIDLWSAKDSVQQAFHVKPWAQLTPAPVKIAPVTYIKATGQKNNNIYLSGATNNCNNNAWLQGFGTYTVDNKWNAVPVEGHPNVYTFQSQRTAGCDRTYLSVSSNCGHRYVDLWHRDDKQGNQWWLAEKVPGQEGKITFRVGHRSACEHVFLSYGTNANRVDLWKVKNTANQWFTHEAYVPEAKIELPETAMINVVGKNDFRNQLSASRHCNDQAARLQFPDTFQATNQWKIKAVEGKHNTFTIQSTRGCDRTYVSNGRNCGQTYIDLWFRDDGTGLQHWTVARVPGSENTYSFNNAGRHGCHRRFFSTRDVWDRIDLWHSVDSNRQKYEVNAWEEYNPTAVNLPALAEIRAAGKSDNRVELGYNPNNCDHNQRLRALDAHDIHGEWSFVPVEGKKNVYNIIAKRTMNCERNYLSVSDNCGHRYLDLWHRDEKTGQQQFLVEPVGDGSNKVTFKVGGRDHCEHVYLSFADRGDRIDLWKVKNTKNQHFTVHSLVADEPIQLPSCVNIASQGKTDGKSLLAWNNKSCDNRQHLVSEDVERDNFSADWTAVAVEGEVNTYNLIAQGNTCDRKFLSVSGNCGHTYVDLWNRDDNTGNQRFTIVATEVEGRFTFRSVGRDNCHRRFFSTRDVWDRIDLWSATDNNNQWFGF
jgi:hypothetical protein